MIDSASIAISVRELSKCYQIYDRPRDRLKQSLLPRLSRALGKQGKDYFREFWALRGASFDIASGETVGIVGRNGSGKSTLLQIICGILAPTQGQVEVEGRVAALLELGAGFNPEFTGRENVYLNGSVLGLKREEIERRFDDIASFAEIGRFLDQPIKTYSSGMVVRLGFAVAINVDPDILVVDEALAVGDERFQRKCYSRIEQIKADGATVLFVSHSGATIVELCERAILLDEGRQLAIGPPKLIIGRYQRLLYADAEKRATIREAIVAEAGDLRDATGELPAQRSAETSSPVQSELQEGFDPSLVSASSLRYEPKGVEISEATIRTLEGKIVNNLRRGRQYRFCYRVRFTEAARSVRFGMGLKTVAGVFLGGGASAASAASAVDSVSVGALYVVDFSFICRLNVGAYFLDCGVLGRGVDGEETFLHRLLDAVMFRVLPEVGSTLTGAVDFDCVATARELVGLETPAGVYDERPDS
jgi:lipopolysaccharide transport system ATP-binding protein